MTRGRRVALAVVCLLAITVVFAAGPGSASTDGVDRAVVADGQVAAQTGDVDADGVLMRVELREDGTAEWAIEHRVRLETDEESAAFEELRDDVRENPESYEERFVERMGSTVAAASEATNREMAIENVSVDTRYPPGEYGVLVYQFEWTGFATVEDDRLVAGDALAGLFLDDRTRLLIAWPEGYEAESISPEPDDTRDRTAVWNGPIDFGPNEPNVVVAQSGWLAALPTWLGGAVAGGAVLVLVGGWLARRGISTGRDDDEAPERAGDPEDDESERDESGKDGSGRDVDESRDDGDESVARDEPPDELLTNEERVLRLLDRRGGRMKQQDVVETLDWTEAKTSQVVGDLREEGNVETFRIGRENVLALPETADLLDANSGGESE